MAFEVIDNPDYLKFRKRSGFSNAQFKKLAGLYSRAASVKALYDIGVDVDFEENVCTFTYYKSNTYQPYLQFIIRQVGPKTDMYEVYKAGKGRLIRSGLFDRALQRLEEEVLSLMEPNST
jgi:hypothetical protein